METSGTSEFQLFLRSSSLVVSDADVQGLNIEELKAKYPRFRQYYHPVKIADDQAITVSSSPTSAPVAEVPLMVTSAPSLVSDVSDPNPISCVSDVDGDFFIASSFIVDFSQVDFAYEIVSDPDVADLSTEVLPVLEKAIIDSILPEIFGTVCSERRLETNNLRSANRRGLIGASASPPDIVSGKSKSSFELLLTSILTLSNEYVHVMQIALLQLTTALLLTEK